MLPKLNVDTRLLGVTFPNQNEAEICVWAPTPKNVALKLTDTLTVIPLQRQELGYWHGRTPLLKPGNLYTFVLDDEMECQDPASLSQPEGILGPSQAIDTGTFCWEDQGWVAHSLEDYIIYEVHVGAFTSDGTFAALESKLDYLKELGINAIEIMPIGQFANSRNWGYDGVFTFAAQNTYGGAKALQHLINACHFRGIAVVLDVVYNHFGPDGNFLTHFGPYLTNKYCTPWGDAVNFDDAWCDGVRRHLLENALMWFRDFHIDALRIDAAHAIKDCSPVHMLQELRQRVDQLMEKTGRQHYLIVECDLNDPRYINPISENGFGMDAQWIDEFHHSLRVTIGEEQQGYYADFKGISDLAKSFQDAYVYDGQFSAVRQKIFGRKAEKNPGRQFIVFSQNHDQIGNRKLGERSSQLYSFDILKVLAGAVLLSPYIPFLFMGEEWGETNPFLYFISHTEPELAERVRQGRQDEFASFRGSDEPVPDPQARETFEQAELQWNLRDQEPHKTLLQYYQTLIELRKQLPALHNLNRDQASVTLYEEPQTLALHRWHDSNHVLCLLNFSKKSQCITLPGDADLFVGKKIFDSADAQWQGGTETPVSLSPDRLSGQETTSVRAESVVVYARGHEKFIPSGSLAS